MVFNKSKPYSSPFTFTVKTSENAIAYKRFIIINSLWVESNTCACIPRSTLRTVVRVDSCYHISPYRFWHCHRAVNRSVGGPSKGQTPQILLIITIPLYLTVGGATRRILLRIDTRRLGLVVSLGSSHLYQLHQQVVPRAIAGSQVRRMLTSRSRSRLCCDTRATRWRSFPLLSSCSLGRRPQSRDTCCARDRFHLPTPRPPEPDAYQQA